MKLWLAFSSAGVILLSSALSAQEATSSLPLRPEILEAPSSFSREGLSVVAYGAGNVDRMPPGIGAAITIGIRTSSKAPIPSALVADSAWILQDSQGVGAGLQAEPHPTECIDRLDCREYHGLTFATEAMYLFGQLLDRKYGSNAQSYLLDMVIKVIASDGQAYYIKVRDCPFTTSS